MKHPRPPPPPQPKVGGLVSRLTVAMPKARDGRDRAPSIPASVVAQRAAAAAGGGSMEVDGGDGTGMGAQQPRKTEKDLMWENGGPGVYSCDYRKYYDLKVGWRSGSGAVFFFLAGGGHSFASCTDVAV